MFDKETEQYIKEAVDKLLKEFVPRFMALPKESRDKILAELRKDLPPTH